MFDSLWPHRLQHTRLLCPPLSPGKWMKVAQSCLTATPWTIQSMNSPGQNTGVGSLSLLQRIFPIQGLNPGLLHCRQILYQLSHKGSPLSPRVCLNSYSLSQWCYLTILSSPVPFSFYLKSFSASGSFPISQLLTSGGQSIGTSASASILSMNICFLNISFHQVCSLL